MKQRTKYAKTQTHEKPEQTTAQPNAKRGTRYRPANGIAAMDPGSNQYPANLAEEFYS